MKTKQIMLFVLSALVFMACSLLSRTTPPPSAGGAQNETVRSERITPTLPSVLSLHQAWAMAWPDVEAWAADARPTQKWSCSGRLQADGACNQWQGMVASADQIDVANIIVSGTGVKVQPSRSEIVGKPAVTAAFSKEGIIDSSQVAQAGWDWLKSQNLWTDHTLLRDLNLRSGPGSVECGEKPAYMVSFDSPPGQLCLDAYTGAVIYSSYSQ